MSEELCYLGAAGLAARISAGELSPVEVVRALRERAEQLDPAVNAVVTRAPDAEERAREAEAAVRRGDELGPLHGVPFTVKDTIDTAGLRTTRGSRLFADRVPERDAAAVALLEDAGAILLGKTNTPEFALWWETDNLVFGRTANPWNTDRTAGGSSGGEAAAVAAGLSPLGLGSDLGGSIRLPAHCCGVVGLKPTHGRVPLEGNWPETLLQWMHVGPMAASVEDVALAFGVLAPPGRPPSRTSRIALVPDAFGPIDAEVAGTVRRAAGALAAEEAELPRLAATDCNALTLLLYGAGGREYFAGVVGDRRDELHPVLRERLGREPPSPEDVRAAEAEVDAIRAELGRFFEDHDLLLCPTAPAPAGRHGETQRSAMRTTIPFDLTGSPALSVPFGRSADGLPIGVQLVGRHFEDERVLAAGRALEAARGPWPRPGL